MTRRSWNVALAMTLSVAPAWGRPLPKSEPVQPARACPEMGEGFVRLPGSDTCIRLGGSVRVEVMRQGGGAAASDR